VAGSDGQIGHFARQDAAHNFGRQRVVGRRAVGVLGHDRQSVHHRPIETRHVYFAGHVAAEHASGGFRERNVFLAHTFRG